MQNTPTVAEQLKRYQQLRRGTQINFFVLPAILAAFHYFLGWETLYSKMQTLLIALAIMYIINIGQFIYYTRKYQKLQQESQGKSQGIERL
ncbi:MAG: hypothetical protein E6Q25_08970 [Acinetobacter sp.]|nr:MAG: hypothetical protein E6Q25_08970 [Acinetobacter sp.]